MTLTLSRPADVRAGLLLRPGTARTARPVRQDPTVLPPTVDVVDRWGMDSFPASDPPANW